MNKAIRIFGERLTEIFNLRTTKKLMKELKKEAGEGSVNTILNSIIKQRYFKNDT